MNFLKIDSNHNKKIKYVAALQQKNKFRKQESKICLEGFHLLQEVTKASPTLIETVFITPELAESREAEILQELEAEIFLVNQNIIKKISSTNTSSGIVSIAHQPKTKEIKNSQFILFLENIQDPGNLGTIIRTASATGVETIVCDEKTTDPWSAKVLRSGMGGHFKLQIKTTTNIEAEIESFGGEVFGTFMDGKSLFETKFTKKTAFILGNEGQGISENLEKKCNQRITIPMENDVESLNVGISASLCCYEHFRQNNIK